MELDNLIRCDHISFRYSQELPLFNDVSFSVKPGMFYLVRGPSGSGKSSLLRLLNRLEEPSDGQIYLRERPFSGIPAPELRRQILYIQQSPVVVDGSVRDNLLLPFAFRNNKRLALPEDSRLRHLLDEFSLDRIPLDKTAKTLSIGQQQRLCLIRGLLLAPSVVLLDEPTSALDQESSLIVERMAESLCMDQGKAVIMVSHKEFNPERVSPVTINVSNGRLMLS